MNIIVRTATEFDIQSILTVFAETILTICTKDYTLEQRIAWASSIEDIKRWKQKINEQYFLVAEYNNQLVGFGSLEDSDHIDLLYTHKDFQGKGIASTILTALEHKALQGEAQLLTADVSKTARVFFEKNGFHVVQGKTRLINSLAIGNYRMAKKC